MTTASPKQIAYIHDLAPRAPKLYVQLCDTLGVSDETAPTREQARAMLDALVPAAKPATDRQVAYVRTLASEVPAEFASLTQELGVNVDDLDDMNAQQASDLIDALTQARKERRVIQQAEADVTGLAVGVYMRNGTPIRVYPSQRDETMLLAKQLSDDGTWQYMGAAYRFVRADMKMTIEEAKQYGADFGICACCGRELTDDKSIMLGIGPVCFRKYF